MRYSYKDLIMDYVYEKTKNNHSPLVKVACILDEFSYNCFKYEGDFIQLTPKNYKNIIQRETPEFLLVEAAWEGYNGEWINKVSNLQISKDHTLSQLVNYCKENHIPTVFWAKEDPYDFEMFIEAASLFDYVFTTDSSSIDKYKDILKHEKIFLLPFAAQPQIHNPINRDKEKKGQLAFAGGWYSKFPQRSIDMENVLEPAFKYHVKIYDRFRNTHNAKNKFPEKYNPFIVGGLNYLDLIKEYKKYDVFLNVNSTQTSPTNFSRRVFEVLASGTPLISSYSLGIENYFKNIVYQSNSKSQTEKHIETLLKNEDLRDRISLLGQRQVFKHHTYKHRIDLILDKIGLKKEINCEGVSVITCSNRDDALENILENYLGQNYPLKELIIIINKDHISIEKWQEFVKDRKDIKIFKMKESKSLGECLNYAVEQSIYPYISKFDDDDYYGPNYLIDSINAFKYTDSAIVGKQTVYALMERTNSLILRFPNHENRYTEYIAGSTITFKKEIFNRIKFKNIDRSEDTNFLIDAIQAGYKIYSLDRFNHIIHRRANLDSHTWKISEMDFLKNSIFIANTLDYKEIVKV